MLKKEHAFVLFLPLPILSMGQGHFSIGIFAGPDAGGLIGDPLYRYRVDPSGNLQEERVTSPGQRLELVSRFKIRHKHSLLFSHAFRQYQTWENNVLIECFIPPCTTDSYRVNNSYLAISASHEYRFLEGPAITAYFSNGLQLDYPLNDRYFQGDRSIGAGYLGRLIFEYRLGGHASLSFSPFTTVGLRPNRGFGRLFDLPYRFGFQAGASYHLGGL